MTLKSQNYLAFTTYECFRLDFGQKIMKTMSGNGIPKCPDFGALLYVKSYNFFIDVQFMSKI